MFLHNGFDNLAATHDDIVVIINLLHALKLVATAIGGETGFAVAEVVDQAKATADNALGQVESMLEERGKKGVAFDGEMLEAEVIDVG